MENGAEECNAIVNMAELAHARSIRGVSACSDPRLVYKTLFVGISGAVLENYSTPPGKNSGCSSGADNSINEEKCHFVPVSSRVFYKGTFGRVVKAVAC